MQQSAIDDESPFGTYGTGGWRRLIWRMADARLFPQRLRQRLRKRFARPHGGPFDVVHDGMRLRLYPSENYCDRVIFGRSVLPEQAEHDALAALVRPGMTFVDVGANVGSYTIFVGTRAGPQARLIALEPHPRTYRKLRFNMQANGLSTKKALNLASGPEKTVLKLWSDGGSNIGHTSLLKEGTANPRESVDVLVEPLVDILKTCGAKKVDLLKIDIEGYEDRVLAPFLRTASETLWPAAVLIEISHRDLWENDLLEMLAQRGYRLDFQTAENRLYLLEDADASGR